MLSRLTSQYFVWIRETTLHAVVITPLCWILISWEIASRSSQLDHFITRISHLRYMYNFLQSISFVTETLSYNMDVQNIRHVQYLNFGNFLFINKYWWYEKNKFSICILVSMFLLRLMLQLLPSEKFLKFWFQFIIWTFSCLLFVPFKCSLSSINLNTPPTFNKYAAH